MNDAPLHIDYDLAHDVVTIEGVKYSGELFRAFSLKPDPYRLFSIVDKSDTVTIRTYMVDIQKFQAWQKTQEQ